MEKLTRNERPARKIGRPRTNPERPLTPAERQAAYRRRLIEAGERDDANCITIDRAAHDRMTAAIGELSAALDDAARRGVSIAQTCAGVTGPERIVKLAQAIRRLPDPKR